MDNCTSQGNCTGNEKKKSFVFSFYQLNQNFILAANTCQCNQGFKGSKCNFFDCSLVANCSSHGICSGKNNLLPFSYNFEITWNFQKDQTFALATMDTLEQCAKILFVLM